MTGFDVLGPGGPLGPGGDKLRPYGVGRPFGGDNVLPQGGDEVAGTGDGSKDFVHSLSEALHEVRQLQVESRDKARALAAGEPVEVHDLMISMGKSEVAFNMMLEVRNKLLEAWQTLQRSVS